jgi:hypothetical protein
MSSIPRTPLILCGSFAGTLVHSLNKTRFFSLKISVKGLLPQRNITRLEVFADIIPVISGSDSSQAGRAKSDYVIEFMPFNDKSLPALPIIIIGGFTIKASRSTPISDNMDAFFISPSKTSKHP